MALYTYEVEINFILEKLLEASNELVFSYSSNFSIKGAQSLRRCCMVLVALHYKQPLPAVLILFLDPIMQRIRNDNVIIYIDIIANPECREWLINLGTSRSIESDTSSADYICVKQDCLATK